MVGPVVVLDISEQQLSQHAQDIYSQLKSISALGSKAKAV